MEAWCCSLVMQPGLAGTMLMQAADSDADYFCPAVMVGAVCYLQWIEHAPTHRSFAAWDPWEASPALLHLLWTVVLSRHNQPAPSKMNAITCYQSGAGNALQPALLQIALTARRSALTFASGDLRPQRPNKYALTGVIKISRPIRQAQKLSEIVLTSNGMLTYNPLWGGLARQKPSGIAQMLR
jgi:hypothetical protein